MGTHVVTAYNMTIANAAVTLAFINPPTSGIKEIAICRVEIGYHGGTTAGQVPFQLVKQASAFPTLTSATPQKLDLSGADSAIVGGTAGAAGTAGTNASAEGAGTKTVLYNGAFNRPTGMLWVPTVEERIKIPANAGYGFGVYLPAAQTGFLSNWEITVVYLENY